MKLRTHSICRLVKSEDLNHHGTLFAGKTAMWFVESGFIAAASLTHPENIVCLNIHGMLFEKTHWQRPRRAIRKQGRFCR